MSRSVLFNPLVTELQTEGVSVGVSLLTFNIVRFRSLRLVELRLGPGTRRTALHGCSASTESRALNTGIRVFGG